MRFSKHTFKGGIHPAYKKDYTRDKALKQAPLPSIVRIPLAQHIGAPSKAVVKAGDIVKTGQVIAEAGGFVSVPQHASISGKVKTVKDFPHPFGRNMPAIEIESDGTDTPADTDFHGSEWTLLSPDEIKSHIRNAGIVGLGGAAFPTHVKLSPPQDKTISTLLINGAECEPYLTCDHRIMLEHAGEVITGIRILQKALGATRIYIGIENNKVDALELFSDKTKGEKDITIIFCETKYPQGSELQLMKAALGIELPKTRIPLEAGVVIQNVGTAYAVYEAITAGKPLYERALTLSGEGVSEPGNFIVRIGTLFDDIISLAGGIKAGIGNIGKMIMGGPMMGLAQFSGNIPVIKGTSGILLLPEMQLPADDGYLACIRCGKCEFTCPMKLPVARIGLAVEFGNKTLPEELAVMECMECGCCSYVCPSSRPMTQFMRLAKVEIMEKRSKKASGNGK